MRNDEGIDSFLLLLRSLPIYLPLYLYFCFCRKILSANKKRRLELHPLLKFQRGGDGGGRVITCDVL